MKDQQYDLLQTTITKEKKQQDQLKINLEDLRGKFNSLISQVQAFVLDDQQQKIKQVLLNGGCSGNNPSEGIVEVGGSTMLFMHYSDKLHALTQVIKSSFIYMEECRRQALQIDECLICGDNFESLDNVENEEQWFQDMLSDDKTKMRLECGHDTFHKQCIKKWLRVKPHCPLCNKKVE